MKNNPTNPTNLPSTSHIRRAHHQYGHPFDLQHELILPSTLCCVWLF
jgi:hypothetical protein